MFPVADLDQLRDIRDATPPDTHMFTLVETHLLAGIAHLALGDQNAAATAAEAALAAAEPDRLMFPFAITAATELLQALRM
jgi:LuxR family maltose regulon positive regulatory protein